MNGSDFDLKIKKILLDNALIDEQAILQLQSRAKKENRTLEELVVDESIISDDHLGQLIADSYDYKYINLSDVIIDEETLKIIPELVAKNQQAIAFEMKGETLKIAMNDPSNLDFIHLMEKKSGMFIEPYYATHADLKQALNKYRKSITDEFDDIMKTNVLEAKKSEKPEDVPIIRIADTLLIYAYQNNSSDIHIEPYENKSLVRFRIDGILHDVVELPKKIHNLLITRLKIMSKLRIDEHRAAQDGKLQFMSDDGRVDVRVSILPIVEGEKIVMRILSSKNKHLKLEHLGFSEKDYAKVEKAISRPHGMILVTGPTGSGKSTTLYAVLNILNSREVNISTIEDPVEYDIEGVNQIQVNNKTNLTFANGLRALLRQDPDIIMVGEIRDRETAEISINSAMTGHLVLSTLHTNDAATTIPRFIDMGIEPFLISSTVNLIIAQRLVRKLCHKCVASYSVKRTKLVELFSESTISRALGDKKEYRLYKSKGCAFCKKTGYKGRMGIYEILEVSSALKDLIMKQANAEEIHKLAVKEGMTTMVEDGLSKVLKGETSAEEVLRVTKD